MQETKIQFKALRECVGLSQAEVARLMYVNVKSVKRWESAKYLNYHAPDEAWDLLISTFEVQRDAVKSAVEIIEEQIEEAGGKKPSCIDLRYWRKQEDYDENGCDEGSYLLANANSRAVANYVLASGLCENVQFHEGATPFPPQ